MFIIYYLYSCLEIVPYNHSFIVCGFGNERETHLSSTVTDAVEVDTTRQKDVIAQRL